MSAESSLSSLSSFAALPAFVRRLVDRVVRERGFAADYRIHSAAGSKHGDGLQGIIIRLTVCGRRVDEDNDAPESTLTLICKMTPQLRARRERFGTSHTFPAEVYSYERIFAALAQLQRERGVEPRGADGFGAHPQCHGTHSDATTGEYAIVMSDVRAAGFRMLPQRAGPATLAQARCVMRALGRFHACSLALKHARPDVFEPFKRVKCNSIQRGIDRCESIRSVYEECMQLGQQQLRTGSADPRWQRMQFVRDNYSALLAKCVRRTDDRFSVLNHTDCWNNNFMFRYDGDADDADDDDAEPSDVCIVDWQMMQYGSPAIDIMFYLFCALGAPERRRHFDQLLHDYHDSCSAMLRRLGCEQEVAFGYADLLAELHANAVVGLIFAFVVMPVATAAAEAIPDLDDYARRAEAGDPTAQMVFVGPENVEFGPRIVGVMEDFCAKGFALNV